MFRSTIISSLLLGVLLSATLAQTTTPLPANERSTSRHDPEQDSRQEMLREMEVKRAENDHKQNIERAKESAQLGVELRDTYARQKALAPADLKKLARVEKLARQLRSEAGGSDDEEPLKDPPKDMKATLARIAELTEELRKCIEKTPRQVISAGVIAQANELLELVRLARTFAQ